MLALKHMKLLDILSFSLSFAGFWSQLFHCNDAKPASD